MRRTAGPALAGAPGVREGADVCEEDGEVGKGDGRLSRKRGCQVGRLWLER